MNPQVLWPCIFVLAGACVIILGDLIRMKLRASESWPKTTGMIIESTIKSEWAKAGSDRIYVVKPKVVYEYQVDGKRYASSHLALVEFNTANESSARKKSEKYHVGQQVTVYYNPRKPDSATLEIGDPTRAFSI